MSRPCLLLSVLGLLTLGCGSPTATVTGTVTFQGKPLPSGTVLFHGADGRVAHAVITDGGRYALADAPIGPVRISVKTHAALPTGMPTRGGPPPAAPKDSAAAPPEKRDGKYVRVPSRYHDPNTSGLTVTVRTGAQTHDIELRP